MKIGNNIKFLRNKNQFTQEQLAERLGVSYQAVSKWETNSNTPDISLLPEIAALFNVSIDTLFADNISDRPEDFQEIKDDNVIRIVQMRGKQILKVTSTFSQDDPPIEIAFPHDCDVSTQNFKVEIFGHVISLNSIISGEVICHQTIKCSTINAENIQSDGDIRVNEINSSGKLTCNNILDCYRLQCKNIECAGSVNSANLTCDQIIYRK